MSYSFLRSNTFITTLVVLVSTITSVFFVAAASVQEQPGMEGSYSGYISPKNGKEKVRVGLVVTAKGENEYKAVLYFGGLPWNQENPVAELRTIELTGIYTNYTLRLSGDFPLVFQFIHNRFTALDEGNSYRGHLEKVVRVNTKY